MVRSERHELRISEDNVLNERRLDEDEEMVMVPYLEIIDNTFSVKVIVGDGKEVPVKRFAPGILLSG